MIACLRREARPGRAGRSASARSCRRTSLMRYGLADVAELRLGRAGAEPATGSRRSTSPGRGAQTSRRDDHLGRACSGRRERLARGVRSPRSSAPTPPPAGTVRARRARAAASGSPGSTRRDWVAAESGPRSLDGRDASPNRITIDVEANADDRVVDPRDVRTRAGRPRSTARRPRSSRTGARSWRSPVPPGRHTGRAALSTRPR